MPPSGENKPPEDLMDRLRTLFGFQAPQNKNALPPKAHFSIWYLWSEIKSIKSLRKPNGASREKTGQRRSWACTRVP